jgi:chemotaxis protein CheX
MELIQPFIDSADAVLAELLQASTKTGEIFMEEGAYRRKGIAALISIRGDIEGRVIVDLTPEVAFKIASHLNGGAVSAVDEIARETVCELANMIIGNSITLLNDQGFRFKVFPPEVHVSDEGLSSSADTEALVICMETSCGEICLNVAMRYLNRRQHERTMVSSLT